MKKLILFFALFGLMASCNTPADSDKENIEAVLIEDGELSDIPELSLLTFDTEAENYVDQEVRVSGIVDHVCKHGGKKLLLVMDDASVHVESDDRFEDELVGQELSLNGIVREYRVDEGECLKMEEDNIANHQEGESTEEDYVRRQNLIQSYRDSMQSAGLDHLSYYSLDFVAFNSMEK